MEPVRRVLTFLGMLLLLLAGVELLAWTTALQTRSWDWYLSRFLFSVEDLPLGARYALSGLMILLPLFVASLTLRAWAHEEVLIARTRDKGLIRLTETAVRKVLRREGAAIEGVAAMASSVRNGERGPKVVIRVRIHSWANAPEVQALLRQQSAEALRRVFGISELDDIQIIVEDLVFPPERPATRSKANAGKKMARGSGKPPAAARDTLDTLDSAGETNVSDRADFEQKPGGQEDFVPLDAPTPSEMIAAGLSMGAPPAPAAEAGPEESRSAGRYSADKRI